MSKGTNDRPKKGLQGSTDSPVNILYPFEHLTRYILECMTLKCRGVGGVALADLRVVGKVIKKC